MDEKCQRPSPKMENHIQLLMCNPRKTYTNKMNIRAGEKHKQTYSLSYVHCLNSNNLRKQPESSKMGAKSRSLLAAVLACCWGP